MSGREGDEPWPTTVATENGFKCLPVTDLDIRGGVGGVTVNLEELQTIQVSWQRLKIFIKPLLDASHSASAALAEQREAALAEASNTQFVAPAHSDGVIAARSNLLAAAETFETQMGYIKSRVGELDERLKQTQTSLAEALDIYRNQEARARHRMVESRGEGMFHAVGMVLGNVIDFRNSLFGWDTNVRGAFADTEEISAALNDTAFEPSSLFTGKRKRGEFLRDSATGLSALTSWLDPSPFPPPTHVTKGETLAVTSPPTVSGLVATLYDVSKARPGAIGTKSVLLANGKRHWFVFIPGTQGEVLPGVRGFHQKHGRDWPGALKLASGKSASASDMTQAALEAAGAKPGDSISLVGHSQGGMAALRLAADTGFANRYRVRAVVTAGSPIRSAGLNPNTQYLHLENGRDPLVAGALDGGYNEDLANRTTVRTRRNGNNDPEIRDGGNAHGLDDYRRTANAMDRESHPSVDKVKEVLFEGQANTRSDLGDQVQAPVQTWNPQ